MAETLEFELVSPEKLLVSEPVGMVVVPGVDGDFGALPQHAPMLSTVRPGIISIYKQGQVSDRIFVAGGFAEVTADRCTVLAEEAIPVANITEEMVAGRLQAAKDALQEADSAIETAAAEASLRIAEAMGAARAA